MGSVHERYDNGDIDVGNYVIALRAENASLREDLRAVKLDNDYFREVESEQTAEIERLRGLVTEARAVLLRYRDVYSDVSATVEDECAVDALARAWLAESNEEVKP